MKHSRLKKPTKRQIARFLLNSLFIVFGNAIAAAGAAIFVVPNGFTMGGVTGLGMFVGGLIPENVAWGDWVVNITVYVVNIALFILGAFLLGKKFAISTLAGTLLYPTFLSIFKLVDNAIENTFGGPLGMMGEWGSPVLAAVFGGLMFGIGVGIVMRVGSSTGGTDIPALIAHKYLGAPISVCLWAIDICVIFLQSFTVADPNLVLYGIGFNLICAIAVGVFSPIGTKQTQVKIISRKYEEIRLMILNKIDRGVTILYGETGYLREDCRMLLTVVSRRQLIMLKAEVEKIDPEAFMTVSVVSEVRGRGFKTDGVDFLMPQDDEGHIQKRKGNKNAKD